MATETLNLTRTKPTTKPKRRRKKKLEFSKLMLIAVSVFTVVVTVFTMYAVIATGDTSALQVLIPSAFAEFATATGFYYSKAKAENKIKLRELYGKDAVDDVL